MSGFITLYKKDDEVNNLTQIDTYQVSTYARIFFVPRRRDIYSKLTEDEKVFSVEHVSYVGNYKGREDVICLEDESGKVYMTHSGAYDIEVYFPTNIDKSCEKGYWKLLRGKSLKHMYEGLGVIPQNNVYKLAEIYENVVSVKLGEIKEG